MTKRLVICCDGTWNSHDDPSPTNVYKLRNLVLPQAPDGTSQSVYYHSGVGTSGAFIGRAIDGLTGRGLSDNIRQAYRALIDNYEPGDVIYLVGFSRGAFTVRSLAGLIRKCGILRRGQDRLVEEAYDFYRDTDAERKPDSPAAEAFRQAHAVESVTPIHFIGIWETVGSLGNPLWRHSLINRKLQFHDVKLSSYVGNAFQALAIDEYRMQFQPAIWKQQPHSRGQVMRQVWFIGAHSDVGGGYANAGLSNIALEWMARRAVACGLALDEGDLTRMLGGAFPAYMTMPRDSHRGFYRWFPSTARIIDKPDEKEPLPTNERLHWTVMARFYQDLGYRPASLVDYLEHRQPGALAGDPRDNPLLESPG